MKGTVIQGSFPTGRQAPLARRPDPGLRRRPQTYEELTIQAHARSAGGAAQTAAGGAAFALPPHLTTFGRRPGQRLPLMVQQKMESFFNADFSDVQIHVGPEAASIGALAFTQGSNIYFAPGQYNPHAIGGQQLLGHELAHVMQQRAGRVRNPFGGGIAVVQDRALEAEAEHRGHQAAAHREAPVQMMAAALQASSPVPVSDAVRIARGQFRIVAGAPRRPAGSVRLHDRGRSVELTDLGVEPAHRGSGLGRALLASALKAAARLGKRSVTLASQDNGSGALTRWYRTLGFRQVGVDRRGFPRLEAPVQRAVSALASRAHAFPIQRAALDEITVGTSQFDAITGWAESESTIDYLVSGENLYIWRKPATEEGKEDTGKKKKKAKDAYDRDHFRNGHHVHLVNKGDEGVIGLFTFTPSSSFVEDPFKSKEKQQKAKEKTLEGTGAWGKAHVQFGNLETSDIAKTVQGKSVPPDLMKVALDVQKIVKGEEDE